MRKIMFVDRLRYAFDNSMSRGPHRNLHQVLELERSLSRLSVTPCPN